MDKRPKLKKRFKEQETEVGWGYTAEEYYNISIKEGLPKRCPILRKCCRAVRTRFLMGFHLGESNKTFEGFLESENQYWEPEEMIKEVEQTSTEFIHDTYWSVDNSCPEVTLFEQYYLPFFFKQRAFGDAVYYKESRRFEATAKHYSECAEFSEFCFNNIGQYNSKLVSRSSNPEIIPERLLEDYLIDNLGLLESELKFIERQKSVGTWKVDIHASDSSGADVLIELKSSKLNRSQIDSLCGQVSRYFNSHNNSRMFVVVPRIGKNLFKALSKGLEHWIKKNEVVLYQFDYSVYEKRFRFQRFPTNTVGITKPIITITNFLNGLEGEVLTVIGENNFTAEYQRGFDEPVVTFLNPAYHIEFAITQGENFKMMQEGREISAIRKHVQFSVTAAELFNAINRYCIQNRAESPYNNPIVLGLRIHSDLRDIEKCGWEVVGREDGRLHNRIVRGKKLYLFRKELILQG